ncbi:hypothetical protein [Terricaulis sp.]|uniref:hypothetical protein n=1 Tax=Terricaulis sp. TaxID=2768686 RepID=UPI003784EEF4
MGDETLAGFLGLDDPDKTKASARALARSPEIGRAREVPAPLRDAAAEAVIWTAKNLLNTPLSNLCADAWSTYREFDKARNAPAGKTVDFTLKEHDISLSRQPSVELIINGVSTGVKLPFDLSIGLNIASAVLKIRDGAIVGCDLGKVKGAGSISCAGVTITKRETSTVRLPGKLAFDPGVMLR